MQGFAKVRIGKKDFLLPYNMWGLQLVRITNHPLDKKKLLVWRQQKGPMGWAPSFLQAMKRRSLLVHEAKKSKNMIEETGEIADLIYDIHGKKVSVWDFKVDPRFRRKTIGTALRETMLRDLKGIEGVGEVWFPSHDEAEFYLKRGFKREKAVGYEGKTGKVEFGYIGKIRELGVKPAGIKLKVLWQRSRPRL